MGGRKEGERKGEGTEERRGTRIGDKQRRRELSRPSQGESPSQKRFEVTISCASKMSQRAQNMPMKIRPNPFYSLTVWIWCKGLLFSRHGQLSTPDWSEIEISYLRADGSGGMFLIPLIWSLAKSPACLSLDCQPTPSFFIGKFTLLIQTLTKMSSAQTEIFFFQLY